MILYVLDTLIFLSAAYGLHCIILDIHWLDVAVVGKFIKQYAYTEPWIPS